METPLNQNNPSVYFTRVEISLSNSEGDTDAFCLTSSPTGLGGKNDESGGMYFESLTYVRVGAKGSANKLTLNLIDNTSTGIEQKLAQMYRHMKLTYHGMRQFDENNNGGATVVTHGPYDLLVTDWQTTLTPYGARVRVEAISLGLSQLRQSLPRIKGKDNKYQDIYHQGQPSDVVKKILEYCGFSTTLKGVSTIEETTEEKVPDVWGDDPKQEVVRKFRYGGGSAVDFINKEIIPYSHSTNPDHKRTYVLNFSDELENGKPVAIFKSADALLAPLEKKKSVKFEYNTKNSFVQSWNPVYRGKQLLGISGVECCYTTPDGKVESVMADGSVDPEPGQSPLRITTTGSKSDAQFLADMTLKMRQFSAHRASITLINYSDVHVGDFIDVIAKTKEGKTHHTSGNFYVESVTDNVSSGMITTSLELKLFKPLADDNVEDRYVKTHN